MKILLSTFCCNPEKGSEPAVGWNWLRELAKENEVWVMFYDEELPAVMRGVAQLAYKSNIHLCPIGVPSIVRKRFYMQRYEAWNFLAYQKAKKLCREVEFSVVHQLTIGAWWNCGYLWRLKVPFVFGPVSGDLHTPKALYRFLKPVDRVKQSIRSASIRLAFRCWPRSRKAIKKAALVIASTPESQRNITRLRKTGPTTLMFAGGVDPDAFTPIAADQLAGSQLRIIFSGLLIPRKNLGLVLEALRQLPPNVDWRLRVVGDGPERANWESQARSFGVADRIEFLGSVPLAKMLELYKWANAFVFPSSRDSNATVVMEAMVYGLPIVALKIPGNELLLNEESALLVDVQHPDQVVQDFASMLEMLAANPALRQRLGAAARARFVREFGWGPRMKKVHEWYAAALKEPTSFGNDATLTTSPDARWRSSEETYQH